MKRFWSTEILKFFDKDKKNDSNKKERGKRNIPRSLSYPLSSSVGLSYVKLEDTEDSEERGEARSFEFRRNSIGI